MCFAQKGAEKVTARHKGQLSVFDHWVLRGPITDLHQPVILDRRDRIEPGGPGNAIPLARAARWPAPRGGSSRLPGPPLGPGGRVWFAGPMPSAAAFRSRLVAGADGAWSVIPSPLSVRALAAAGLDYVVIDLQHGGAAEADLPAMTSAIRLAGATPVARVRHAHTADIGRALDLGCEGVIVPNVEGAAQAHQVASAVWYPPAGHRSAGGVLAVAEPFCLVMAESAGALAELDATLATDGVDGLYVGPRERTCRCPWAVRSTRMTRSWTGLCSASGRPAPPRQAGAGARHRRRPGRRYQDSRLYRHHDGRRRRCDHPQRRRPARPRPGLTTKSGGNTRWRHGAEQAVCTVDRRDRRSSRGDHRNSRSAAQGRLAGNRA